MQPEGCNSSPHSLIIAAALMTQRGSRCCTEMKEEMQRIYNASQITDKAQRKQNFARGLHHQGDGIKSPDFGVILFKLAALD